MGRHLQTLTILEGPDGCGKSALASKFLEAKLAHGVLHHGPYLDDGPEVINRYLSQMRHPPKSMAHVIFDRSWLSEPIYGWVRRHGQDRVGIAGRRYCERLALACQGVVLMPATDFETCAARYIARKGDEYLTKVSELKEVYNLYAALGTLSSLPTYIVDTAADIRKIFEIIQQGRPRSNQGPGIGHWHPGHVTLIVGEKTSESAATDLPFIVPDNNTAGCSFWLAEKLESWKIREAELYWVNALDNDGKETDPSFLTFLRPQRVVALGKTAERWCRVTARIEKFKTVEHPQYWKRFHYHQDYPLKEALLV